MQKTKEQYFCRDCNKKIVIKEKEIINGKLLAYDINNNKKDLTFVFKCNECFEKDPSLSNFQECEVYSRIVGYLRPIKQWNPSKQEEYKDRKTYKEK